MLPVPERGRGPGQSALEDAGLPEARGHPGAAQPVGEEDRAAQSWGGGRAGPAMGTRHRDGESPPQQENTCARWLGEGGGAGVGVLPACVPATLAGWSPESELIDGTESPQWQGYLPDVLFLCRPASTLQPQRGVVGGRLTQLWVPV